jgi:hypothetical protein
MGSISSRLRRLWRGLAALAACGILVAVGVAANALTASGGSPPSGPARIAGPMRGFPGAYVRGSGLFRAAGSGRAALAGNVSSPLAGSLAPVAAASPDGKFVVYDVWRPGRAVDRMRSLGDQGIRSGDVVGTPSLWLHDTVGGRDRLLENGAYSGSWRADGALAYVRGAEAGMEAAGTYLGDVVVRGSVDGPAQVWTTDRARYVVAGWAGSRLVAYRIGAGEQIETLVLDGPGKVRVLAGGTVVAISPDGGRVLVVDDESLRVVDVASGAETARLGLADARDPATGQPLGVPSYSGSWKGDRVVAAVGQGLAVFAVAGGRISVDQVLELDPAQFPVGVQEPQFTDDAANQIVAVAEIPPAGTAAATNFLLSCDRAAAACERGDPAPATDWVRLVRDGSRTPGKGGN